MNVTKIKAMDMHQAMDSISREYGPDAVLLNTQRMRKKGLLNLFSKPYYEVVVGYDPEKTPVALRKHHMASSGAPAPNKINAMAQVTELMPPIRFDPIPLYGEKPINPTPTVIKQLTDKLISSRVTEKYAHAIARKACEKLEKGDAKEAHTAFTRAIESSIKKSATVHENKKTVLFFGPSGVGKTTSLLKLAADYSRQGKKVGIVNADAYRIAACEQMKLYADMLDIPLKTIYAPDDVLGALAEMSDREIILIDTAGKRPGDPEHKKSIQRLIELGAVNERLLTISAQTSFSTCKEIIDSYSFLSDYELLITKTDETELHGNILNICMYSGKAISYLTTGQNIPGDMENADTVGIASRILLNSQFAVS